LRRFLRRNPAARSALCAYRGTKVRTAEEGLAVGGGGDGHRPSAAAGQHLNGIHVDGIDVGALFAVDLECLALLPREAIQSRLELASREALDGFRGNDERLGARPGVHRKRQLRSDGRRPSTIQEEVSRDPEEPGAARCRIPEPRPGFKCPLEGRLNQVVRVGGVAGQPPGKRSDVLQIGKRQNAEFLAGHTTSLLPQTAGEALEFRQGTNRGGPAVYVYMLAPVPTPVSRRPTVR